MQVETCMIRPKHIHSSLICYDRNICKVCSKTWSKAIRVSMWVVLVLVEVELIAIGTYTIRSIYGSKVAKSNQMNAHRFNREDLLEVDSLQVDLHQKVRRPS